MSEREPKLDIHRRLQYLKVLASRADTEPKKQQARRIFSDIISSPTCPSIRVIAPILGVSPEKLRLRTVQLDARLLEDMFPPPRTEEDQDRFNQEHGKKRSAIADARLDRAESHHRGLPDVIPGYEQVPAVQAQELFMEALEFNPPDLDDEDTTAYRYADQHGYQKPRTVSVSPHQLVPDQLKNYYKETDEIPLHYVLKDIRTEGRHPPQMVARILKELNLDYGLLVYMHRGLKKRLKVDGYRGFLLRDKIVLTAPTSGYTYVIHSGNPVPFLHRASNDFILLNRLGLVSVIGGNISNKAWEEDFKQALLEPNPVLDRDVQELIDQEQIPDLAPEDFTLVRLAQKYRWNYHLAVQRIESAMAELAEARGVENPQQLLMPKYDNKGHIVFVYPLEIDQIMMQRYPGLKREVASRNAGYSAKRISRELRNAGYSWNEKAVNNEILAMEDEIKAGVRALLQQENVDSEALAEAIRDLKRKLAAEGNRELRDDDLIIPTRHDMKETRLYHPAMYLLVMPRLQQRIGKLEKREEGELLLTEIADDFARKFTIPMDNLELRKRLATAVRNSIEEIKTRRPELVTLRRIPKSGSQGAFCCRPEIVALIAAHPYLQRFKQANNL